MPHPHLTFPSQFIWGTATAAYQIEGAADKDGRGPSIWDTFSHIPGNIADNATGDVACDHYNRLDEDLALIAGVVSNYRFSISWSRILPQGTGAINQKGVDFYNRLIDGLLARGITPWVTLYHWDLPQALQDKGGWTNRDILKWFAEYADICTSLFGDRVKNWIILNEPSVASWIGHGLGFHAPGLADEKSYLTCVHHMNLAIGATYRQLKAKNAAWNVGSSYTLLPNPPESAETPADIVAHMDGFWNRNFFDPLMLGTYPAVIASHMAPYIQAGDMEIAKTRLDFVGVQHYNAIEAGQDDKRIFNTFFGKKSASTPKTDVGWTISPEAFYDCLSDFKKRYGDIPLLVTENGAAYYDTLSADGACHDTRRIAFLQGYIAAMHRAMKGGVNITGYFVWSFMDNFEWSEGYKPRFGLVHIDYANNCKRTPKDSYFWYRDLIAGNILDLTPQKDAA